MRVATLDSIVVVSAFPVGCSHFVVNSLRHQADAVHEFRGWELNGRPQPYEGVYAGTEEDGDHRWHRFAFSGLLCGETERTLVVSVSTEPVHHRRIVRVREVEGPVSGTTPAFLYIDMHASYTPVLFPSEMPPDAAVENPRFVRELRTVPPESRPDSCFLLLAVENELVEGWYRGSEDPPGPAGWRQLRGDVSLSWVERDLAGHVLTHVPLLVTVPVDYAMFPIVAPFVPARFWNCRN